MQSALPGGRTERRGDAQRMQHELPVTEIDALRQAGRAGGVESGGAGVFVEIGEVVAGRRHRRCAS